MLLLQSLPARLLTTTPPPLLPPSPLMLCDRLLSLAQDADRAGHLATADQLIRLAHSVLDGPPSRQPA